MKAVRIFACGDIGVLKYDDYAMPDLGPGDVLVRVLATSVSRWDVMCRAGTWQRTHQEYPGRRMFVLPMQLGRDAVGVVEAVGADVSLTAGDRVVGLPHPENPDCPLAIRGSSGPQGDTAGDLRRDAALRRWSRTFALGKSGDHRQDRARSVGRGVTQRTWGCRLAA